MIFSDRMITLFGPQMLRYKGVLYMKGADRKVVFQGVQQLMGTDVVEKWDENHPPESKLVFIGKNRLGQFLWKDFMIVLQTE